MTKDELVDRLAEHRTIGKAPREELAWIAAHGTLRRYEVAEVVSSHTEPVGGLYILLSGRISISVNRGGRQRKVMQWNGGDATGVLPYSRLGAPPGDTVVEEAVEAVVLDRSDLPGLIQNCQTVTEMLVHVMTDRARQFTSAALRDEKLVSLGKLAAGLAHELNNPASAAVRDAKSLPAVLTASEEATRALCATGLTGDQLAELDRLRGVCANATMARVTSGLALSDREEEIGEWLTVHGVSESVAGDLARTSITRETLDRLAGVFPGGSLETALRWLAAGCAARSLATDIERAAARIHGLVSAVKGFTHMDRDPDLGPVDLATGLFTTVALLEGKARGKSVALTVDIAPDVPSIQGISVEINQIWMNLIDNAIDAAPAKGCVDISVRREGRQVIVRVVDDGPGIPPDVRQQIFDPFFTTKSVGEGTGLGLDIVRRIVDWHNGTIEVASEPGRTEFRVSLPVSP